MTHAKGPTYKMHVWENTGAGGAKIKGMSFHGVRNCLDYDG